MKQNLLEVVFETLKYIVPFKKGKAHALHRYLTRFHNHARIKAENPDLSNSEIRKVASEEMVSLIENGTIIFDYSEHRYIRNGDYLFTTLKIDRFTYVVKTVLKWDWFKENKLQKLVDRFTKLEVVSRETDTVGASE